jgi:hypothetical protein
VDNILQVEEEIMIKIFLFGEKIKINMIKNGKKFKSSKFILKE